MHPPGFSMRRNCRALVRLMKCFCNARFFFSTSSPASGPPSPWRERQINSAVPFAPAVFQRVKEFYFLSLTRWGTIKKECRFRRSVLVGVHRYGRERIGGKQKILIKPHFHAVSSLYKGQRERAETPSRCIFKNSTSPLLFFFSAVCAFFDSLKCSPMGSIFYAYFFLR